MDEHGAGAGNEPPVVRRRQSGILSRHRTTILLGALVLYTLALGVAVCDDVFHLGLFPTALEREALGHIRRFESADEAVRREAAEKLVREVDGFVAIPALIEALDARSPRVRELAADCLRRITNVVLSHDPADSPAKHRAEWRRWWRENRDRF